MKTYTVTSQHPEESVVVRAKSVNDALNKCGFVLSHNDIWVLRNLEIVGGPFFPTETQE